MIPPKSSSGPPLTTWQRQDGNGNLHNSRILQSSKSSNIALVLVSSLWCCQAPHQYSVDDLLWWINGHAARPIWRVTTHEYTLNEFYAFERFWLYTIESVKYFKSSLLESGHINCCGIKKAECFRIKGISNECIWIVC